jgi:aminopeptidase-like protein
MLSKHELYPRKGGGLLTSPETYAKTELDLILWLLFYCDGKRTMFDLSTELSSSIELIYSIAKELERRNILKKV